MVVPAHRSRRPAGAEDGHRAHAARGPEGDLGALRRQGGRSRAGGRSVGEAGEIASHVGEIVVFSEMDLMGLPWRTWAVREFLPTMPVGVCPSYGDMPVCREVRCFVVDGEGLHPYWPEFSLQQGGADIDYWRGCCSSTKRNSSGARQNVPAVHSAAPGRSISLKPSAVLLVRHRHGRGVQVVARLAGLSE